MQQRLNWVGGEKDEILPVLVERFFLLKFLHLPP